MSTQDEHHNRIARLEESLAFSEREVRDLSREVYQLSRQVGRLADRVDAADARLRRIENLAAGTDSQGQSHPRREAEQTPDPDGDTPPFDESHPG